MGAANGAKLLAAVAVVVAGAPAARAGGDEGTIVGTVYVDGAGRDGELGDGDQRLAGYRVELAATDAPTATVDSRVTNGDGEFAFTAVPSGSYRLRVASPSGVELAETTDFTLAAGQSITQIVRVDPTGRVYDAVTGAPVAGVRLLLQLEDGTLVPSDEVGPGQQGQVTSADGIYRFDWLAGRRYRIAVDTSQSSYAAPSTLIPPRDGFAPAGAVVPNPLPDLDGDTAYYLAFDAAAADYAVLNNHIPVDPLAGRVLLAKRPDRPAASVGDVVAYTITATNRSARDLSGVFVSDTPARGLTVLPGQVRGAIGGVRIEPGERFESPSSRRLVQFGSFDIPAGETLTLAYHVVVGVDTRPGDYDNRARVVDGAGVSLSNEAKATLRVESDAMLDEALIVGRVFCDDDGDGELDEGETGLMGARVYIDTGSYAVTDSAGLYHLSQVDPGTHLIKLDADTLSGGSPTTPASEVVSITRGLPVKIGFGVRCRRETVARGHKAFSLRGPGGVAVAPAKATAIEVKGSIDSLRVTADGSPFALPAAALVMVDERFTLGFAAAGDAPVAEWVLDINRHDGDATALVRRWQGVGEPPASIDWDRLDADGISPDPGLHSAQLGVRFDSEGALALSRRVPFAIQPPPVAAAPDAETWRGKLFAGSSREPAATSELRARVAAIAGTLGPDDAVAIRVHADGTGNKLETAARTTREARVIQQLLIEAGVAADRITARGRGSLEPLDPANTREARDQNRRVEVAVTRPSAADVAIEVPKQITGPTEVKVSGRAVDVAADGTFAATVEPPVCVEILADDGRLAANCSKTGYTAASGRTVTVRGDFATGTFTIDGAPVDHDLMRVDVRLRDGSEPPAFDLSVPAELEVASWKLAVAGADGTAVYEHAGKGAPPAEHTWNGDSLQSGARYLYALSVVLPNGARSTSAARAFEHDPPPPERDIAALAKTGRLFRGTKLRASLKNHLSRVASALDAGERYIIRIGVAVEAGASVSEQRLAAAARAGAVRRYLTALRVAPERYELIADPVSGRGDTLRVAVGQTRAPVKQPEFPPAAAINGDVIPVVGLDLETLVSVPVGESVVFDVLMPTGQQARFVSPALPVPDAPPPPEPETGPDPNAPAGELAVILPARGARLGAPVVPVHGRTAPGSTVAIDGNAVHVRGDGRFDALVGVRSGRQTVTIASTDSAGNVAEIKWPVDVAASSSFAMLLGEGIAASAYDPDRGWTADDAWLDGMSDQTTVQVGPVLLHGRAAAYFKARFRKLEITAHVDTAKDQDAEAFFEQVVDPGRSYAVFGDSAQEIRDVNARGVAYLHVRDGEGNSATLGNIRSRMRGGELFRFDRTVYGAAVRLDGVEWNDDHAIDANAFTAFEQTGLSRDINLFRATGGSLYYLRNDRVVEGSEQVRIVVRDRDTGLILSDRTPQRDADYAIDYPAGRILFHEPIASSAESGWLLDNLTTSTGPLDGHPVFVEVQYEHEAGGLGGAPTGLYVRDTIKGVLAVGAGVVGEGRDTGDYRLWGTDVSYRIDDRSRVFAEVGASKSTDGDNFLSTDGGLSFGALGTATADYSYGWKIGANLGLTDATSASVHAQSIESGFSSGATILEQGHTKFGALVSHRLNETDVVAVRNEGDVAELDDRTQLRSAVQWRRAVDDWAFTVEGGHDLVDSDLGGADAHRAGVGARVGRKLNDTVTVRAGQEIQAALADDDPILDERLTGVTTSAGADFTLAPDLVVSADEIVRWNGDNATRIGFRTKLGDAGSTYVREQFGRQDGKLVTTTIVGASDRFGPTGGGRSYGEYQLENGALGQRNRAVMGLGHRWRVARGVRLGLGYEHQQVFGGFTPEGEPVGNNLRDLVHASAEYVRADLLKAGARVELRWDNTDVAETLQIITGVGADAKATPDVTLLGRIRLLRTEDYTDTVDQFTVAGHTELIAGAAYRPVDADWLDVFAQYAYQIEQRPADEAGATPEARSHVASVAPVLALPLRLSVSSKLAWKKTRLATPVLPGDDMFARTDALLWLLRVAYKFYGHWDVAGEYRRLALWRGDGAAEARDGTLFELSYTVARRVRLGVGYNFSHFSDNELGNLERDAHGAFFRLVGHY